MPSLLRLLPALAFTLLASCSAGPPAFAQEPCAALESVIEQAREAAAGGAEMHVLDGPEAVAFLALLVAQIGEPPRKIEITSAVLLIGPAGAVAALGEGVKVCFNVPMAREFALIALRSVKGTPA